MSEKISALTNLKPFKRLPLEQFAKDLEMENLELLSKCRLLRADIENRDSTIRSMGHNHKGEMKSVQFKLDSARFHGGQEELKVTLLKEIILTAMSKQV